VIIKLPDGSTAHVSVGGPDRKINVNGTVYLFEDHPVHGPSPVTKTGRVRELSARSPFWEAVTRCYQEGKKIDDDDGFCEWSPAPDDTAGLVRVGRNLMPIAMAEKLAARFDGEKRERIEAAIKEAKERANG
jgi:hypothetical protein